jgi:hypothetical protein
MKVFLNRMWLLIANPLKQSFKRFPEALTTSFLLGILMVINNELETTNEVLLDINRTLFLVLPLMISLTLIIERWQIFKNSRLILLAMMLIIGGLFFTFLTTEVSQAVELNRFIYMGFAFYGLVIFLPYLMDRQDIGVGIILFFTKLFTSLFYALVLYIGIFIILITSNVLFGLSIDLMVYTNILILILSFVFLPTLLDSYPIKDDVATVEKNYHMVWQRVFTLVIAPVITVFSFFIILYLILGSFSSNVFESEVYTFSALVIAFVGISSQIALAPFVDKSKFFALFVKYFHLVLIVVMVGYYIEQFKTIGLFGISLDVTVQLILGFWPLLYAYFVIRKSRVAIQRGLLSLTGAFLMIAAFPVLNAVSLTTLMLNAQLQQTLQRESMISEEGQIIRKDELTLETYNYLFGTLDEMAKLGLDRFPLIPDNYEHPGDFEATFGDRERDPDDLDGESLTYLLNYSIIDLSDLRYESLTYIDSLAELELTPFANSTIAISFIADEENHSYQLTVIREEISETVDLYEDVAQVLQERFEENFKEMSDPEDLLVQITFDTFALDFWVMNLGSSKFETYSSFSMSFYLGLSSRNG